MVRDDRTAEGGRTWARTIAATARHHRRLREWSQQELADRMNVLGYRWVQRTVSDVERNARDLTFDEVAALAIVLGIPPLDLFDPVGPGGDGSITLSFGDRDRSLSGDTVRKWLHGHELVKLEHTEGGWRFTMSKSTGEVERMLREKEAEGPVDRSARTFAPVSDELREHLRGESDQ